MRKLNFLFAVYELDRIGINSPPIYSYKTFDDLIKELNKRHDFFEKAEILRLKTTVVNNSKVNNINKNKPNDNKIIIILIKFVTNIIVIYAKLKVTLLIIVNIIF